MKKGILIIFSLFVATSAQAGLGEELCRSFSENCDNVSAQFYCDQFEIGDELCSTSKMSSILRRIIKSDPLNLKRQALIIMELNQLKVSKSESITETEREGLADLAALVQENWIEVKANL